MAYVIAVSGGSGSGKSTLAEALVARLGSDQVVLFHEDAYYWPRTHYPEDMSVGAINYDHPASKDAEHLVQDLNALKQGHVIDQPVYDYGRHDRSRTEVRRLAPATVILLEGIHALSIPQANDLIDLRVYVDTPDDLRLARRIRRDVVERDRDIEGVLSQYRHNGRAARFAYTG
ncbi:MAG: AAA family ATPase, partial [Pseudomonadota bacterium]